jgi:hypothetical protein
MAQDWNTLAFSTSPTSSYTQTISTGGRSRTNSIALARDAGPDYMAVEKTDGQTWTLVGLELCKLLHREMDNRNPELFGLKPPTAQTTTQFQSLGTLEVLENHLRILYKHFKNACKKKSPQSAWRPVFAHLESLTLYLRDAHIQVKPDDDQWMHLFHAFGCAWVGMAIRLASLGLFSETNYPSMRCAVNAAITFGTSVNEMAGKEISNWPDVLESVWTGSVFDAGAMKTKLEDAAKSTKKKNKDKKKAAANGADADAAQVAEEAKKRKMSRRKEAASALVDPEWDLKEAIVTLKADRKHIGGNVFDLGTWSDEQKNNFKKNGMVLVS